MQCAALVDNDDVMVVVDAELLHQRLSGPDRRSAGPAGQVDERLGVWVGRPRAFALATPILIVRPSGRARFSGTVR